MADDPKQPKDLNIGITELHSAITALNEKLDKLRPQCAECSCGPCIGPCVVTYCQPCHPPCQPCHPCYPCTLCIQCIQCVACQPQCVLCVQCVQCHERGAGALRFQPLTDGAWTADASRRNVTAVSAFVVPGGPSCTDRSAME